MRTDEIHRYAVLVAKVQKLWNPLVIRGGRPADPQPLIHFFNGLRGDAIELEIVGFCPRPKGLEVGLIPDFEEPCPDFVDTVALDPMSYQAADKLRPGGETFRRRHVGAVMKHRLAAGRKRRRHEAQLDKGFHSDRPQKIADLIDVEKRVAHRFAFVPDGPQAITENVVEAHVAKAKVLMTLA